MRGEIKLASFFKAIGAVQPHREKYICFVFPEIMIVCLYPASLRGALRAIVTTREAGMRWPLGLRRRTQSRRT